MRSQFVRHHDGSCTDLFTNSLIFRCSNVWQIDGSKFLRSIRCIRLRSNQAFLPAPFFNLSRNGCESVHRLFGIHSDSRFTAKHQRIRSLSNDVRNIRCLETPRNPKSERLITSALVGIGFSSIDCNR